MRGDTLLRFKKNIEISDIVNNANIPVAVYDDDTDTWTTRQFRANRLIKDIKKHSKEAIYKGDEVTLVVNTKHNNYKK